MKKEKQKKSLILFFKKKINNFMFAKCVNDTDTQIYLCCSQKLFRILAFLYGFLVCLPLLPALACSVFIQQASKDL